MFYKDSMFNAQNAIYTVALTTILTLVCMSSAYAETEEGAVYAVVGGGYALYDVDDQDLKNGYGTISLGYNLDSQWALELGVNASSSISETQQNLDNPYFAIDGSVRNISLSVLGKAKNSDGELYYRLGVAHVRPNFDYFIEQSTCSQSGHSFVAVVNSRASCTNDEALWAGVVGLGYDWRLYESFFVRFEATHSIGSKDYSATGITLGIRYNF